MSTKPDADLTLPSVMTALPDLVPEQELLLTIIFHPDITRIGEVARLSCQADAPAQILGRRSPAFSRADGVSTSPVDDDHVSRQALALVSKPEGLVIQRLPLSSRCRIGGSELHDTVALTQEQLKVGVPILLGHSVVLLLRFAQWREPAVMPGMMAELCGSSAYMSGLRDQLVRLASTNLDVLVRGETGTGKELVAAAIHRASKRRDGPMVSVNMAAVTPSLAAASLFGNARGAYTGATRANAGYFRQAQGGTLFMDEIGDTPADVQPQLLRALQEREIQAVGGSISKVDVRVISATDAALEGEGCDFKAALRYRLGASEISLRPLREHAEDIGELLLHFMTINLRELGQQELLPSQDTPAREIAVWADLFHRFLVYAWPGNVRELANFASQVAVASSEGLSIPDNVRLALQGRPARQPLVMASARPARRRNMRDISEAEFKRALETGGYEVANVARQLLVSRQSIYRRMDESPLYRLAGQIPLAELEQALAQCAGDASAAARDLKVSLSSLRSRLRDSTLEWF